MKYIGSYPSILSVETHLVKNVFDRENLREAIGPPDMAASQHAGFIFMCTSSFFTLLPQSIILSLAGQ